MVRASHLRAIGSRAGKLPEPPEPTPIPGTPTYIRRATPVEDAVFDNNHTVQVAINVPYSGGALLIPFWTTNSTWVAIGGKTRNISTNQAGNTVNTGVAVDAWAGGGSESHGGAQCAWIINPTVGNHLLTVSATYWDNFELLGASALFYANCTAISGSGIAAGGGAQNRTFNVASATGRTTLGIFAYDNGTMTGNGTSRLATVSSYQGGWVDRVLVQELPGAASVTHSIATTSGGGWGFGLDLRAA